MKRNVEFMPEDGLSRKLKGQSVQGIKVIQNRSKVDSCLSHHQDVWQTKTEVA